MSALTPEAIWRALEDVHDPEIPVLSVVDLGIIRSVGLAGETATVVMTPTFAGCPALGVMREAIEQRLRAAGAVQVQVRVMLAPAWRSDWITPRGRERLKAFGLAPPPRHAGDVAAALRLPVACPYCDSEDTRLTNDFGPTLCRAIYVCQACRQPFEQFKPL